MERLIWAEFVFAEEEGERASRVALRFRGKAVVQRSSGALP